MNSASLSPADDPPAASSEAGDTDTAVASEPQKSPTTQKHLELIQTLIWSLDTLIYIELSALHYLDCAFGLLILRVLIQLLLLTPRPTGLPEPPARSALGAVVGSNIFCILLHLVNPAPEAGEATHFYLHGSILIDFVGQLGPTSKWRLFGMDTLVMALQVVMLGLEIEKRRIGNEGRRQNSSQDLEAEEAGIRRSETFHSDILGDERNGDMEMQDLQADGHLEDGIRTGESNAHPLDHFYTGGAILARLNLIETIGKKVTDPGAASASTSDGVSVLGSSLPWRSLG